MRATKCGAKINSDTIDVDIREIIAKLPAYLATDRPLNPGVIEMLQAMLELSDTRLASITVRIPPEILGAMIRTLGYQCLQKHVGGDKPTLEVFSLGSPVTTIDDD